VRSGLLAAPPARPSVAPPAAIGPRGAELAGVAALLFVVLTVSAWAFGAASLFGRGLWYDEGLTQTLVADPSFAHAMKALAGGVETHPPTFYLALREVVALTGRADEVVFRSFSWLCAVAALAGVYATLRFAFRPLPSLAAVLALGAHPLVLSYAVEARHYALLLAEIAWLCYFLRRAREPAGRRRFVAAAVLTAVLAATTHYFGIIGVGLVLAGDTLVSYRSAAANRARAVVLAAAVAAVVACVPLVLSQRAALSVPTWLEPPDRAAVAKFLTSLFLVEYLPLGLVGAAGLAALLRAQARPASKAPGQVGDARYLAGAVALALFPFVLLALSSLYHPVFGERYALPAVIALAPPLAWLFARAPRWVVVVVCAGFVLLGGLKLRYMAEDFRNRDADRQMFYALLRGKCPGDAPIVFHMPERLGPLCRYAPDLAPRAYQLDYEPADLVGVREPYLFNRDLARGQAKFYGRPPLFPIAGPKPPVLYLVLDEPPLLPGFRPFAAATSTSLGYGVFELRFPPEPAPPPS
jgi:hypothetical protein